MMIVQMIPVSNPSDCSTVREKTSTVHECALLTQTHTHTSIYPAFVMLKTQMKSQNLIKSNKNGIYSIAFPLLWCG